MTSVITGDMKCFLFSIFYFIFFIFFMELLLMVLKDCCTLKVRESEETAKVQVVCNGQ